MANDKQSDEIIALESIFTNEEFTSNNANGQNFCTLKIFNNLPTTYHIVYKDLRNPEDSLESVAISHLPPLTLNLILPQNYPDELPPEFKLCCSWLDPVSLTKLCKKLDNLWTDNKGQEIIFTWAAFLQNDILDFLNIPTALNVSRHYTRSLRYFELMEKKEQAKVVVGKCDSGATTSDRGTSVKYSRGMKKKHQKSNKIKDRKFDKRGVIERLLGGNIVQTLLAYNEERMSIEFKKNFYSCKICFADKSGESCTQFKPCEHVFCKECITEYLEVKIKDGAVQNIGCPEEKCDSEASPAQIKSLVSPELFAKYDSILLSATLDTMLDIVYCPRRHCQYPVSKEANEKMASCPSCGYVFCIFCKMVYHGIEPCKVTCGEKIKLVAEYQSASDERKLQLESRYGKKQLQTFVENTMSETWINKNSLNCPHCNTAIEKSDGCNKMTCGRCKTFFCWGCGTRLDPSLPYIHYQDPKSKCYRKLYEGLLDDEDDEDDDIDFPAMYLDYDSDDDDFYDEDFVIDVDL